MEGVESNLKKKAAFRSDQSAEHSSSHSQTESSLLPSLHSAFRVSRAAGCTENFHCGKRAEPSVLSEALLASIGELLGPTKKVVQAQDLVLDWKARSVGADSKLAGLRVRDENSHPNLPLGSAFLPNSAFTRTKTFGLSLRPLTELVPQNEPASEDCTPLLPNFNF